MMAENEVGKIPLPKKPDFQGIADRSKAKWREARKRNGLPIEPETVKPDFEFKKDSKNREIAIPVGNTREARYYKHQQRLASLRIIAPDFGMLTMHRMSGKQRKIFDLIKSGENNVIAFGPTGPGKTALLLRALTQLHANGSSVRVIVWPDFKRVCDEASGPGALKSVGSLIWEMSGIEYLLIDDIGNGTPGREAKQFELDLFNEIMRQRDGAGLYTWVTTNFTLENLVIYGPAAVSRLRRSDRCIEIDFDGMPNKR